MLEVNLQTLCRLIDLAEEFHAHQNVDITEEPETIDDWASEMLESHEENPFLEEFRSIRTSSSRSSLCCGWGAATTNSMNGTRRSNMPPKPGPPPPPIT
jgi:hypothetical protein